MPHFGPVFRRDLIRALRALGFDGPVSGGRHQFVEEIPKTASGKILRRLLRDGHYKEAST